MKHVPNTLTIIRILITPVVLSLLFVPTFAARSWAFALFVLASLSDWLDGSLARKYAVGSRLGQFLDPLADKFLVLGTFGALAILFPWLVPWWAVLLVTVRDIVVTWLRIRAERLGTPLKTSKGGKIKTAFQLTFLILVLLLIALTEMGPAIANPATTVLHSVYVQILLFLTVAATVVTGWAYVSRTTHGS